MSETTLDDETVSGDRGRARARLELDRLAADRGRPTGLGHELNAHRDLGYCAFCAPGGLGGAMDELQGWRLLAIAERGVPEQP